MFFDWAVQLFFPLLSAHFLDFFLASSVVLE